MQRYAAGDRPKLRNFWFVPVAVAVVLVILYLGVPLAVPPAAYLCANCAAW